ncbi:MAG: efflux RND transporter periplasmic adaptor subunit [Alphaproteobacteria bacterium]|nr:efflux RND transporter periplasmic adaptor subunit [Alphaproteobacteria bacterium]
MKNYSSVRGIYILILLIMCLISFLLGFVIFREFNFKEVRHVPINDSITLNALPIKPSTITVKNSYIGRTKAIKQVNIVPFVSGYLKDINAKEGMNVKEGDLLISIEPNEYIAKLEASKALVLQTKANYEYNKSYYERVIKSAKAFSETQKDEAKYTFLQSEASFKNAIANEMLAKVNLGYTTIRAPINGRIGNFDLSKGDFVSPQNGGILNIVQTDPIRVVFSLSDVEYINHIKNSDKLFKDSVIKLRTANGNFFEGEGSFKYTDNKINSNTNSLAVYADFSNKEGVLLPNTFVMIEVYNPIKDAVSVEKNYISRKEDGAFLIIARNNEIKSVRVDILSDVGDKYVLKNTFEQGDLLILDNIDQTGANKKINFKIAK